jgi:hypothetical protein
MVYFQAKNPNLGKIWRAFEWKTFGIFYGQKFYGRLAYLPNCHLVIDIVVVLYIFPHLVHCVQKNLATLTRIRKRKSEKKKCRALVP